MKLLDLLFERSTRRVADTTSRRKLLSRLGSLMVVGAALPLLLPIDRTSKALAAEAPKAGDPGDPTSCDYWRYCSIDGFLCSCCGGTVTACPPGAEVSQITWIGTCRNPGMARTTSFPTTIAAENTAAPSAPAPATTARNRCTARSTTTT